MTNADRQDALHLGLVPAHVDPRSSAPAHAAPFLLVPAAQPAAPEVSLRTRLLVGVGLLVARLVTVATLALAAAALAWQLGPSWRGLAPVILIGASLLITWLCADLLPQFARRVVRRSHRRRRATTWTRIG